MSQMRRTQRTGSRIEGTDLVRSFIDFDGLTLVLKFQEGQGRKWAHYVCTPTSMKETVRIQRPDEDRVKEYKLEATIIITQIECNFEELNIDTILSQEAGKYILHHRLLDGKLNIMIKCHDRGTAETAYAKLKASNVSYKMKRINLCSA